MSKPTPASRRRPASMPGACISLALQGGGAFGAFTWGVLDRLLEEDTLRFDALSGASAGAVNGVLLAEGLRTGGRDGAREKLDAFWMRIARKSPSGFFQSGSMRTGIAFDVSTRLLSPYQLNPFNLNPLRQLLEETIDFEALRAGSPLRLLVAATKVADGAMRLFGDEEISVDAVLASACLPLMHQAVTIDGESYWDGGYAANPPILPLVEESESGRILLVQIVPTTIRRRPPASSTGSIRSPSTTPCSAISNRSRPCNVSAGRRARAASRRGSCATSRSTMSARRIGIRTSPSAAPAISTARSS